MDTITREFLLQAGFTEDFSNGILIYSRDGFSILNNGIAWFPCNILSGEVIIGNICLSTMEDIERYINESKN